MTEKSFTAVTLDGWGIVTTEVQGKNGKSLLTVTTESTVAFTDALLGLALEIPQALEVRRKTILQNFERLSAALDAR